MNEMPKPKQRYQCIKALPKIDYQQEGHPVVDERKYLVDSIVEITNVGKTGSKFVDFKVIKGRKPKGNQCIGQYTVSDFSEYFRLIENN